MKKHLLALFLTLIMVAIAAADGPRDLRWERVYELWLTPSQVRMYGPPGAVQSLIGVPEPVGCQLQGVWCVADLTLWGVPRDAKYAFLTGLLIITHGTTQQVAHLHLTFRQPNDLGADCKNYLGQVVEPFVYGGQRSGMATWVPLTDGKVEYCFQYNTPAAWPEYAAYGINLSVQAWAR